VDCKLLPEIDAWLREGGLVVTASERAARFLSAAYHRARRAEGLSAWPSPNIQDFQSFIATSWRDRIVDGRFVLNARQEQLLWARILAAGGENAGLLEGPRYRLADLAAQAHQLLCSYAPQLLNSRSRTAWQQDAGAFSAWLASFDEICRVGNFISAARLPLELIDLLQNESAALPPILLAGFDRVLPTQQRFFSAWAAHGTVREASLGLAAPGVFHEAPDPASELAACAIWCSRRLAARPNARLLVVTQDASNRRGEIERAFLRFARPGQNFLADGLPAAPGLFEFSLGVPIGQLALVRSALLLLRWLTGELEEHQLDWLFASGHVAANTEESRALTAFMQAIRKKGWQRPRWTLATFLRQVPGSHLPSAWVARLMQAQTRLIDFARRPQTSLAWAELVPQLLQLAGWPGARALTSVEFQIFRRWQLVVDESASLGFDGRSFNWRDFLSHLERAAAETLFAPESEDAPILIAGPAESAGLSADAVWFLGCTEDAWPARGATHPLLPIAVQREAEMPHVTPQLDWGLAAAMTRRLLASALEAHFSYPRQIDGVDTRPSRLILQITAPQPLLDELQPNPLPAPLTTAATDESRIPFPPGDAAGGSGILTSQSQCAFKAFAAARLGAEKLKPAEAGLTAPERGLLLHEVMHRIWAGPPHGFRSHHELVAVADLESFVADRVQAALREKIPARARESMPPRYLALEELRLTSLVTEWLRYEQARVPFTVANTELAASPAIAGLTLKLRLDRVDRLNDDSLLVIDYKTGAVKPKVWDLPRPEDIQLPLYASFALDPSAGELGGLVFARLRPGDNCFDGRVKAAKQSLNPGLSGNSNLVRDPLIPETMAAWREKIEQLAEDFLGGRADVDPRDYPDTCETCGFDALCRIREMRAATSDPDAEQAADE
jgi:ATP-dependent helicase/nuclease subunit B